MCTCVQSSDFLRLAVDSRCHLNCTVTSMSHMISQDTYGTQVVWFLFKEVLVLVSLSECFFSIFSFLNFLSPLMPQHLCALLASTDLVIILAVLNLLYVFGKRSNFISRLPAQQRNSLNSYLEYLGEVRWACLWVWLLLCHLEIVPLLVP